MGRHVKKLLRTLPKYADNNGFSLEQSYSKIAVYTLHPSVNANKLLSELVAEDGVALDAFEVSSIRAAYDDFLSRREDRKYDPVFFCAAEKDWQSAGVLACCLDISWDEPGRVGLTRCPEVTEVCMIPAKMSAGRSAQASRGLDNARGSASGNWQGGNASAGYSSSSASAMSWSEIVYEEDYEEWSETIYEESYEEVDIEEDDEDDDDEEEEEADAEEEVEDDEEEAEDEEEAAEDEEEAAEDEEEAAEDEEEAAEDEEQNAEDEEAEDDAEEDEDEAEDEEEEAEDDDEAEAEDDDDAGEDEAEHSADEE